MPEKDFPEKLINKYLEGTCSEQERALVESWHLYDLSQSKTEPSAQKIQLAYSKGRQAVIAHLQSERPVYKLWPRIAAAASILIVLGIGAFFLTKQLNKTPAATYLTDIAPGGNRAILTLGNGRQINLNGAKNGELAQQGSIIINKTADGNLAYQTGANQANSINEVEYNAMNTPIGGQYHLILADGTNVWLNAASSIKYPTVFSGPERKVEITGEVYFEVAHDAAKPFRVISNKQVVEVLGTHFNINAYTDEENTKTTLLEGSVKVSTGSTSITIKPGQQSIAQDGYLKVNDAADLDETVAWKNGYFQFKDEKIENVMRKLSRWYNIELQYQGQSSTDGFNGIISRSKNISQVLKMLEKTKAVHFKIEGRRITVIQ